MEWNWKHFEGASIIRSVSASAAVFALLGVCSVADSKKKDSASDVRARIVGTWELVATEERMTDGSARLTVHFRTAASANEHRHLVRRRWLVSISLVVSDLH